MNRESRENYWTDSRRSRRRFLASGAVTAVGGAALALTGCGDDDDKAPSPTAKASVPAGAGTTPGASATAQIKRGGVTTAPQTQAGGYTDVFDPHISLAQAAFFFAYIGELAMRPSVDATKLDPELVQKWEIPGDGTEILLTIRQGVSWHNKPPTNGRAFTTDDLAFNINRIAGKVNPDRAAQFQRSSTVPNLDSATVVDDKTVRVRLSKPHSSFLYGLSDWRNSIIPRDFVEKGGKFEDPTALVGTGPWTVESFSNNIGASLKPFANYWDKGKPYIDEVKWLFIADRLSLTAAFLKGDLDYFESPTKPEQSAIKRELPAVQEESWLFPSWSHFRFNTTKQPFGDPRVRKAMQRVLDIKSMGDSFYGAGKYSFSGPLCVAFPEAMSDAELAKLPGYNPATKADDIKTAKELMSAAGFPDGKITFKVLINAATGVTYENSVRAQDDWKTVWPGMNITLEPAPDFAVFGRRQTQADFDMIAYTIVGAPDGLIELFNNYWSGGGRNYGKFSDAKIDEALAKASLQIDLKQRAETLKAVQLSLFNDHMSIITLTTPQFITYFQPKIKGMTGYGSRIGGGSYDTRTATKTMWIDKA